MTNALKQYTNENGWNTISVNGREHFDLDCIDEIQPATYEGSTLSSEWIVRAGEMTFTVYGGGHSGGSRTDWFVQFPNGGKMKCTSLIACIRCINNS